MVIGFELGYSRATFISSEKTTTTLEGNYSNSSAPASSDPFSYTFTFQGTNTTAYVPIIYLATSFSSQAYVRYYCPTSCGGQPFPSIASLNISSHLPLIIGLEENGTETKPANISFNSASILEENSTTETIVYTLSFQGDDAGYYSFIFPGSCQLQPVLYIGNDVRSLDLGLIKNWLEMGNGLSQRCPALELDVTLFGLTNTFYDRLPVTYSVS